MFYKFKENWELENSSNVNIDWSFLEYDFSDDQIDKINKWFLFIDWEFIESEKSIFQEKQAIIDEIKTLAKEWEDMRSKYLSTELLPESEAKTEKLRILHERWQEVMTKYLTKETEAIAKYWVEILQEIL